MGVRSPPDLFPETVCVYECECECVCVCVAGEVKGGEGNTVCLVSQLCLTLCDPTDCSPPDSSVHGDSPGKSTRVGCHDLL